MQKAKTTEANIMKRLGVVLVACLLMTGVTYGEGISWFANNNWLNYANGTTRLYGDTDSALGCFVQLVYAGADGTIDDAVNSGYGTTDDDVVVGWRWVGATTVPAGEDGYFGGGSVPDTGSNLQSNGWYYARVWSAPASDYNNGYVSTSLTNYYGNSDLWQYPKSDPIANSFDITGTHDVNTTIAIPEPAAVGLGIIGLMSLRFFHRKRK